MAVLSFNSNPASISIQTDLSKTNESLGQSLERLSSGLRVNKAADDPAGLILAEKLRTDSRVFTQAIKNVSDGISLVTTADDAAQELSNILTRLKELATVAYNSTTSSSQRTSLNSEALALASEYDRIVAETSFNSRKLLDGSLQNLSIQAGYGSTSQIQFSFGQNIADLSGSATVTTTTTVGDGTFDAAVSYAPLDAVYQLASADFDGDGYQDIITTHTVSSSPSYQTLMLGNGNGTFKAPATVGIDASNTGSYDVLTGDFNADSKQDYLASTNGGVWFVHLGNGNGTFKAGVSYSGETGTIVGIAGGDFNEDGKTDFVYTGNGTSTVYIALGNGDGTFKKTTGSYGGGVGTNDIQAGDINGDGYDDVISPGSSTTGISVRLGNGNGTFKAPVTYVGTGSFTLKEVSLGDLNADGKVDMVVAANGAGKVNVLLGNGDGSFKAFVSYNNGPGSTVIATKLADLNGDGYLDIFTSGSQANGYVAVLLGNGNGTFKAPTTYDNSNLSATSTYMIVTDLTGDGVVDIANINNGASPDKIDVFTSNTTSSTTSSVISTTINLLTQTYAQYSISIIDTAASALAIELGSIGAADSRLTTAVNLLAKTRDTLDLARSRIVDVDVAQEVANLVRNQILQQSGVAMLAQANISPQLALSLLEDL